MSFVTYKKFHEKDQVDALTQVLKENDIEFEIDEDRESLDSLYGSKHFTHWYYVKIRQPDFSKANALLLNISDVVLEAVDKDHYLFGFSDDELFDLLTKPDEWNELDYQLAKKILKERGRDISAEAMELLKKQRIAELAKPEEHDSFWIYAGYIFALLGGAIGILIGISLLTAKKTLPDGRRVYTYSQADRRHGNQIVVISGIVFILFFINEAFEIFW